MKLYSGLRERSNLPGIYWSVPLPKLFAAKQVFPDHSFCIDMPVFIIEAERSFHSWQGRDETEEICHRSHFILGWLSLSLCLWEGRGNCQGPSAHCSLRFSSLDCRWRCWLGLCGARKQAMPHPGRGPQWPCGRGRNEGTSKTAESEYLSLYFIVGAICRYFVTLSVWSHLSEWGWNEAQRVWCSNWEGKFSCPSHCASWVSKPSLVFHISSLNQHRPWKKVSFCVNRI